MSPFDFLSPGRVVFGWGRRTELPSVAAPLGRRALVVSGSRTLEQRGVLEELASRLQTAGIAWQPLTTVTREPTIEDVDSAVAALRRQGQGAGDFVLAVGGGSAIDLAKAVAALATNLPSDGSISVREYLEGIGTGRKITNHPLPVLAMPTTAGTGSEATKNAVVSCADPPCKKSLRSDLMLPAAVLIDPELGAGVLPQTTAWSGMDAITQCIEAFVTRKAQPWTSALAIAGLERGVPHIEAAVRDGSQREPREALAFAALMSGLALANSGLGLAHGVAAALGVTCAMPHGLACAVMLPAVMRFNRTVCPQAFARLGEVLCQRTFSTATAAADAAVSRVAELCQGVGIPSRLSECGVRRDQLSQLVAGSRGNSTSGNPRDVTDDDLFGLLESIL